MFNNIKLIFKLMIEYFTQGLAIAIAAYYIPAMYKSEVYKPNYKELLFIALTAGYTLFILDLFSGQLALGARLGAGFSIGQKLLAL